MSDINSNSKKEIVGYLDANLANAVKPFDKFQFERVGFFSVDPDTKHGKVIFKFIELKLLENINFSIHIVK